MDNFITFFVYLYLKKISYNKNINFIIRKIHFKIILNYIKIKII